MNIKILIVESDKNTRRLLSKMIIKKYPFCTLIEATNGIEALVAIENENPHVVFLEARLPMMNGFEMLTIVRNNYRYRYLPIYILTSVHEREIVLKFAQIGVNGYILKPITNTVIYSSIDKIIAIMNANEKQVAEKKKSIILLDSDPVFTTFFTAVCSPFAIIRIASTSKELFRMATQDMPTDVCIVEIKNDSDRADLDEHFIAKKLRNIAGPSEIKIYLLNVSGILSSDDLRYFSGAIKHSFQQSELFNSAAKNIFAAHNPLGKIQLLIRHAIGQQTPEFIRNFLLQKNIKAEITNSTPESAKREVIIIAELMLAKDNIEIAVSLEGEKRHLQSASLKMDMHSANLADSFTPLLEELQKNIISCIEKYGFRVKKQEIKLKRDISVGIVPLKNEAILPELLYSITFDNIILFMSVTSFNLTTNDVSI